MVSFVTGTIGGKNVKTTVRTVYPAAKILIGRPQRPSVQGPNSIFSWRSLFTIIRMMGIEYELRKLDTTRDTIALKATEEPTWSQSQSYECLKGAHALAYVDKAE